MIKKSTPLKEILKLSKPCFCIACNHGCKLGSGYLVENDKKNIADFLNLSIKELENNYLEKKLLLNKTVYRPKLIKKNKMPYGQCIFFKNQRCSIHSVKPLECKIAMPCIKEGEKLTLWFMLNYILDVNDNEAIRQYSVYLKSGGKTLPDAKLNKLIKDKKKLKMILNREI
jgi:Fe-S-cluster containining protein